MTDKIRSNLGERKLLIYTVASVFIIGVFLRNKIEKTFRADLIVFQHYKTVNNLRTHSVLGGEFRFGT